jgi:heterodisulfide reductase subunit C
MSFIKLKFLVDVGVGRQVEQYLLGKKFDVNAVRRMDQRMPDQEIIRCDKGYNPNSILDYYDKEKQRFIENCTVCGLCAEGCPILPYTDIREIPSRDIQQEVFGFMDHGTPNQLAYTKAFACMECFKCTTDKCPEDLNPMLINELIKSEYISRGLVKRVYGDAMQPDSIHRVLASVQVSVSDYRKITNPRNKQHAPYVFFPGCNVYFQPEKILNALDIMDAIGEDYSFLPGLDFFCGDNLFF